MNEARNTLVIITGGTIDAMYSPEEGVPYVVPVPASPEESCIPAALEKIGMASQCMLWPLAMRDSKAIDQALLDTIWARIKAEGWQQVVIVHGTDTLPRSGRYLLRRMLQTPVPARILLTGAMEPLRDKHGHWREGASGWHNLRAALVAAANPALAPGVYIEMGEGVWDPRMVDKHVKTKEAESARGMAKVKHSGFVMREQPADIAAIAFD